MPETAGFRLKLISTDIYSFKRFIAIMRFILIILSFILASALPVQCQDTAQDLLDQGEALKNLGRYD